MINDPNCFNWKTIKYSAVRWQRMVCRVVYSVAGQMALASLWDHTEDGGSVFIQHFKSRIGQFLMLMKAFIRRLDFSSRMTRRIWLRKCTLSICEMGSFIIPLIKYPQPLLQLEEMGILFFTEVFHLTWSYLWADWVSIPFKLQLPTGQYHQCLVYRSSRLKAISKNCWRIANGNK